MLREIDASGFAEVAKPESLGAVPLLQWIAISDLRVDPTYQREIALAGRRNIERIAANFEWVKFSPVIVAAVEGGAFAIIDGQHRATAAHLIGIERVPCQVVIADRKRQAEAFVSINSGVTKMTTLQMFAARLKAGDERAVKTHAAAEKAGVTILRRPKRDVDLKRGETMACSALERIAADHGTDLLTEALTCVMQSKNGDRPAIVRAAIVTAIAQVLLANPQWRSSPRLIEAFDRISLWLVLDKATKAARGRGSLAAEMIAALTERLKAQLG